MTECIEVTYEIRIVEVVPLDQYVLPDDPNPTMETIEAHEKANLDAIMVNTVDEMGGTVDGVVTVRRVILG